MRDGSTAPLDREVLDALYERGREHSLVADAEFESGTVTVRSLVLTLDGSQYPETVVSATFTIRWFENDDYSFHYCERHPDESPTLWECRWDRHPNPHATRTHFHEPPHADDSAVVNDPVSELHPSATFARTMANVRERIETLWGR
jgi:hypothetical protein